MGVERSTPAPPCGVPLIDRGKLFRKWNPVTFSCSLSGRMVPLGEAISKEELVERKKLRRRPSLKGVAAPAVVKPPARPKAPPGVKRVSGAVNLKKKRRVL